MGRGTAPRLGSNDAVLLKHAKGAASMGYADEHVVRGMGAICARAPLRCRRHSQSAPPSLGRADFNDYDVIVPRRGNYASINEGVLNRIKDWLRGGGTLINDRGGDALGDGLQRWAAGGRRGLLKDGKPTFPPPASGSGASGASSASGASGATGAKPGRVRLRQGDPARSRTARVPAGRHPARDARYQSWLTAGNDGETQVMIEGNRVFAPLKLNNGRNVGVYAAKDRLIASGLIWPDAQDILVQKAFLMHQPFGQGHVIAFAEEPNYRAFTESTMLLFMNAVMLGPGY
jgi:hypothetical protein